MHGIRDRLAWCYRPRLRPTGFTCFVNGRFHLRGFFKLRLSIYNATGCCVKSVPTVLMCAALRAMHGTARTLHQRYYCSMRRGMLTPMCIQLVAFNRLVLITQLRSFRLDSPRLSLSCSCHRIGFALWIRSCRLGRWRFTEG